MNLLFNTYTSNEFADGCASAFLELTPELAALILKRAQHFKELHARDACVAEIDYYDCSCVFLDSLPPGDDGDPMDMTSEEWEETALAVEDLESHAARTECDRMVITNLEVYWTCHPKHCDWFAETRSISYEDVRRALPG
jgi:hypothetical protein